MISESRCNTFVGLLLFVQRHRCLVQYWMSQLYLATHSQVTVSRPYIQLPLLLQESCASSRWLRCFWELYCSSIWHFRVHPCPLFKSELLSEQMSAKIPSSCRLITNVMNCPIFTCPFLGSNAVHPIEIIFIL